ncbi:LPXTG cell wall anchor domain-containing protein [Saccharothrix sp. BKS2]|uniref:LPXTG cell wall anchor domain-containing protein n=1 Tax=Saccharothrix sp. BKS2 TaxID=3064400 RepID=UPI0039E807D4
MKLARAGAFLGTLAVATSASVFFAAPAFAHTPKLTPGCEGEKSILTVELKDYVKHNTKKNSVTVSIDGEVVDTAEFDKKFDKKTYSKSSAEPVIFTVDIKAWDDVDGSKGYTKVETREVPSCVEEEEPPVEQPPAEEPPAEEPPAEQPPAEQPPAQESSVAVSPTTTVAPTSVVPIAAEETPLANTGASIAIPLVIGVVLLGGGAALLIMQRRRAARD